MWHTLIIGGDAVLQGLIFRTLHLIIVDLLKNRGARGRSRSLRFHSTLGCSYPLNLADDRGIKHIVGCGRARIGQQGNICLVCVLHNLETVVVCRMLISTDPVSEAADVAPPDILSEFYRAHLSRRFRLLSPRMSFGLPQKDLRPRP